MELEIKRGTFRGCVRVFEKNLTAEESADAVVPDSKPDILRIAEARCFAELTEKELRGGRVYLSGALRCFLLYAPEGGGGPEGLEVCLPFAASADPGEELCRGAVIRAEVLSPSVLAREQNPRRVNVRGTVVIKLELWRPEEVSWCEDIGRAEEFSLELKCEDMRTACIGGFGEKTVSISETAELGEVNMEGAELLFWELRPRVTETRLIPGKAVFKGSVDVRALLKTPGDSVPAAHITLSVPFSGVSDCEGADPDGEAEALAGCFDSVLSLGTEPGTGRGILTLKTNVGVRFRSVCVLSFTAVTDAYSTTHRLLPSFSSVTLRTGRRTVRLRADVRGAIGTGEGVRSVFCADGRVEEAAVADGELRLTVRATVLFEGEDGEVRSVTRSISAAVPGVEAEGGTVIGAELGGEGYRIVSGDEVEFSASAEVTVELTGEEQKSLLVGAEVTERELRSRVPSLTLCGMLEGESWWELGKRMSASVDDILAANGLSVGDEPGDKMLLIPQKAPRRAGQSSEGRQGI